MPKCVVCETFIPRGEHCSKCDPDPALTKHINNLRIQDRCEQCGMPARKVVHKENGREVEHWYCYACMAQLRADRGLFYANGAEGAQTAKKPPEAIKAAYRRQEKYLEAMHNGAPVPEVDFEDDPELRSMVDRMTRDYADSETEDDFNTWCRKKILRKQPFLQKKWGQNAE